MGKRERGSRGDASTSTTLTASSTPARSLDSLINEVSSNIKNSIPNTGTLPSLTTPTPFSTFPLSPFTLNALKSSKFITATPIQTATMAHALAGRDILGAAKTGSGKTLAFIVPLVEKLWRERWSVSDGLGALVLSPTRELAVQIFEVLRAIGKNHSLSAGLITGGKKEFREEQAAVIKMNILVATPGRLLQHLEQTPSFDAQSLQVLVLDEADRILDMGFSKQLNSILDYLPSARQTMLFSATQTKSVKQLARLSLNKPEYISVNEKDKETTPQQLVQNYIVCELPQKLDVMFSFIKSHLKKKTVIFFSSCAQVRFVHEVMCGLQPGVPLMMLHGKIKQEKRTAIYFDFLRKPSAVLFATDVAARGLDFPDVDWVVQMDCPEDSDMYIHRVGRTARNNSAGSGLLCLLPSELEAATAMLSAASIPVTRLSVNPAKTVTVSKRAASVVASNVTTNALAKKAFKSYLKSVHLMPNKGIFQIDQLDFAAFAKSLGLATAPSVRFLRDIHKGGEEARSENREKKNKSRKLEKLKQAIKDEKLKKRIDAGATKPREPESDDESSGDEMADFLKVKQSHQWGSEDAPPGGDFDIIMDREKELSNRAKKRKLEGTMGKIRADGTVGVGSKKTTFDDEGAEVGDELKLIDSSAVDHSTLTEEQDANVERVKEMMASMKDDDKKNEKQRLREKRLKAKGEKEEESESESGEDSGEGSGSDESDSDSSSSGDEDDVEAMEAKALAMLK